MLIRFMRHNASQKGLSANAPLGEIGKLEPVKYYFLSLQVCPDGVCGETNQNRLRSVTMATPLAYSLRI